MKGSAAIGPALDTAARSSARGSARGSATVVMLGVIASVLILTISGLLLASAVLASHRARTAADLAALAAAAGLIRGELVASACDTAAQVAANNHGRMVQCSTTGTEVWLRVSVLAGVSGVGIATARSRAGPGPGSILAP